MTERLPANADWYGHVDDLVTHVLSDYSSRDGVDFQLQDQIYALLESKLEALVKTGRITLRPVRERVCRCWPCTVPLPDETPAASGSASAS